MLMIAATVFFMSALTFGAFVIYTTTRQYWAQIIAVFEQAYDLGVNGTDAVVSDRFSFADEKVQFSSKQNLARKFPLRSISTRDADRSAAIRQAGWRAAA